MKLESIVLSQAARLVTISNQRGGAYWPDVLSGLQSRYKFIGVPSGLEELDADKGVVFQHGKFTYGDRDVVILTFRYYSNGILAQTRSTVEDADRFIDDLLAWAEREYEMAVTAPDAVKKVFYSELEIQLDHDVSSLFARSVRQFNNIAECMRQYGMNFPFTPTGLVLGYDSQDIGALKPASFTLERRANQPFDNMLFYSRAPLTTQHHLEVLTALEELAK